MNREKQNPRASTKSVKTYGKHSIFLLIVLVFLMLPFASKAQLGNALNFDGTNDYVNCGNNASVQITGNQITLEAWIYPTVFGASAWNNGIIDKSHDSMNQGYFMGCGDGGRLNWGMAIGGVWRFGSTANRPLVLNEWAHVATTYDGANVRLYVNGVLSGTWAFTGNIANTSLPLKIGTNRLFSYFRGSIDEVRVWNIARSQADIQATLNSYITPANPQWTNLKAYYRLDQGNAGNNNTALINEAVDYTGNCNKGTLTNFALSGATSNWVHTGNPEAPILATNSASSVIFTAATLNGNIFSSGETNVTTRGFCYATTNCPTIENTLINESGSFSADTYSLVATGLTKGTTYYYRAYATNLEGTSYGEEQSFTTANEPLGNALDFDGINDYINCGNSSSLSFTNAWTTEFWINPTINDDYWRPIISKDFFNGNQGFTIFVDYTVIGLATPGVYLTSPISLNIWSHVAVVFNSGTYSIYINGILAIQDVGEYVNSTTPLIIGSRNNNDGTLPHSSDYFSGKIDEVRIWDIARSQAEIQANLNTYITPANPQWANLKTYYRFDQGIAGGDNTTLPNELIDFTGNCNNGTLTNFGLSGATSNWVFSGNIEAPILTTTAATLVEATVATLNGNIFSIGEANVTTRGFCYSTSNCPTILNSVVNQIGTYTTGAYSINVTGLTPLTTYYYRAYATNAKGTSYGEVQSFTTTAFTPLGNALNFDGTNDLVLLPQIPGIRNASKLTIEYWMYYSGGSTVIGTKQSSDVPKIDQEYIGSSGGFARFRYFQNNTTAGYLEPTTFDIPINQWVHVAYVFDGTLTGNTNRLKIFINGLPITCTAIGTIGATISGSLGPIAIGCQPMTTPPGSSGFFFRGNVDELRIWNTARTQAEIQSNLYTYYTGDMTNLLAYYTFDQGIAGGDNTTLPNELIDYTGNCNNGTLYNFGLTAATSNWVFPGNNEAPILTTNAATSVTACSAILNGNVFSLGETALTTRGFCYSISDCPTIANSVVNIATSATGIYNLSVTGLDFSTTYYYRAYATNSKGTSYGEIRSFTTAANFTAGTIANTGQTICYGENPSVIGSTTDASGGDGIITYQWQSSANGTFSDAETLSSSNSATYTPENGLTTTTTYRRQAHDGTCSTSFSLSTNTWTVTVIPNASIESVTGTSPLFVGETTTYTANSVVLGGGSGVWSSSDTDVATVDESGIVSAIGAGSCNIVYTISGGCSGTKSEQQPITAEYIIISSSYGSNGTISPSGDIEVIYESSHQFDILPNPEYFIADVLVNGVSVGIVSSYEFSNITSNNSIYAFFTSSNLPGDVNGDGLINVLDVVWYNSFLLGDKPDGFILSNADVNSDTIYNLADLTNLINLIIEIL